jgi:hypothetical protein
MFHILRNGNDGSVACHLIYERFLEFGFDLHIWHLLELGLIRARGMGRIGFVPPFFGFVRRVGR